MITATLTLLLTASVPMSESEGESAPPARQLVWGDLDRDGRLDVVVLEATGLKLLHNTGDGALEDWTARLGVDGIAGARAASLADVDGDGDVDLFVNVPRGESRLFLAEEGLFREVGAESGLALGAGVVAHQWIDWNEDGLPDLSLGTSTTERFYENLGEGLFRELVSVDLAAVAAAPLRSVVADGAAAVVPPASASAAPDTSTRQRAVASNPSVCIDSQYHPCALNLRDEATGNCLPASTIPTFGKLFPLGQEFMVEPGGNVGVGITDPAFKLDVTGDMRATQLTLTEPEEVPLAVASTKWVQNLNVDLLDGFDSSAFSRLGASIEGGEITDGTITDADVSATAAIAGTKVAPDFGAQDVQTSGRLLLNNPTSNATVALDSAAVYGVEVFSSSGGGAVRGESTATSGFGVQGWSLGSAGIGVHGVGGWIGMSGAGNSDGVLGQALTVTGRGVCGANLNSGGTLDGTLGVRGEVAEAGTAVFGKGSSGSVISDGVKGVAYFPPSYSVFGDGQFGAHGVVGQAVSGGIAVVALGDLSVSGNKNFVQPHPTDPSREIAFACLEGNEAGTYFRGTSRLVAGMVVIDVPEEFRLVTVSEGLTVQVTERGPGQVWIESSDLDRVVLRGARDVAFDYQVNGVRRGFEDHRSLRENRVFRPRVADEPWGAFLPELLRDDLVKSGVLNADFTPNRATAAQLGWTLSEKAPDVEQQR